MNVRVVNPSSSPFFGAAANPRGRRRRNSRGTMVVVAAPRRRTRRRRNALIMPAMAAANPLILPNRGRRRHGRRRARRNASLVSSNPFGRGFLGTALTGIAGGGVAYWSDRMMLNKLGRAGTPGADGLAPSTANGVWIRNGARVIAGGIAAFFFPGNFGAAINGGFAYPVWGAIDEYMNRAPAAAAGATSAYLNGTDAYLSDVLDGMY
jgi:hypothetical protein